jgi:hypothetical protein
MPRVDLDPRLIAGMVDDILRPPVLRGAVLYDVRSFSEIIEYRMRLIISGTLEKAINDALPIYPPFC